MGSIFNKLSSASTWGTKPVQPAGQVQRDNITWTLYYSPWPSWGAPNVSIDWKATYIKTAGLSIVTNNQKWD